MSQPAPQSFALGWAGLALVVPLALLGTAIGIGQVVTLGTAGHSGILGAGVAILLGVRFAFWRDVQRQNMAHGAVLAAGFAAGNALLLPVGIPVALGRPDLGPPLFLGVALALAVDVLLAWRLFGSPAFPAEAPWPQGAAAAETIMAAREGEVRGLALVGGIAFGAFLAMYRVPMLALGLAFLARPWAVGLFAFALLLRAHLGDLPAEWVPFDLMRAQVPQGVMLGAALVALVQMARRGGALAQAAGLHLAIAVLLALAGGLAARMGPGALVLFVAYAALSALVHAVVCGLAAMHTGWFPGLALAMVALALGLALGFPPVALCLAVGFSAATGPGFIALGHAFKGAHDLGGGEAARRSVLVVGVLAFAIAGAAVWLSHGMLFAAQRIPPMDHVYAIAIRSGAVPGAVERMVPWAVLGAVVQLAGGPSRQLGVILGTGLLLLNPAAGWAALAGLACRAAVLRWTRGTRQEEMRSFAAGVIAGDALFGLYESARRLGTR